MFDNALGSPATYLIPELPRTHTCIEYQYPLIHTQNEVTGYLLYMTLRYLTLAQLLTSQRRRSQLVVDYRGRDTLHALPLMLTGV